MKYLVQFIRLGVYGGFFLLEVFKANFLVVKLVFSPRFHFKSAAIRYQSHVKTTAELVLLANSITLTPGTLVMDADLKTGEFLIHVMSGESAEQIYISIFESLEKRLLWALRGETIS
jgi:multicomponent Na+:H+ antiporter subunit E